MSNYGLLAGIGRGISQGAQIINQGVNADRQAEMEAMRQASIEKRWKIQDERADRQIQHQLSRDKTNDANTDRQFNLRESELISRNINGIMEQQSKEEQKVTAQFNKRLESGLEDPKTLEEEMITKIGSIRSFYSERLHNTVKSYGSKLEGTAFEYLLNPQELRNTSTPSSSSSALIETPLPENESKGFTGLLSQALSGDGVQPVSTAGTDPAGIASPTNVSQKPTLRGLIDKWQDGALSAEPISQQQHDFRGKLQKHNIQSAFGASSLLNTGR